MNVGFIGKGKGLKKSLTVVPAGGVGAAAGAYDTSANRDALITAVKEMQVQLNLIIDALNQ